MYRSAAENPTHWKSFRSYNILLYQASCFLHGTPVALRRSESPEIENNGVRYNDPLDSWWLLVFVPWVFLNKKRRGDVVAYKMTRVVSPAHRCKSDQII
jgi:hypothetical protein